MHAEYSDNRNGMRKWGWGALVAAVAFFAVIALALSRRDNDPNLVNVNVDNRGGQTSNQQPQTVVSPTAKTYISDKLGIQFTYESKPVDAVEIMVTEKDNKIYVHGTKAAPEQGKMIEVFAKPADFTFKQALEQQFLKNLPAQSCFVKTMAQDPQDERPDSYQLAEISFNGPGERCPTPYTRTNAVQYFMYNPEVANKYVFISLGQDSITTDGVIRPQDSLQDWSGSIRIVK